MNEEDKIIPKTTAELIAEDAYPNGKELLASRLLDAWCAHHQRQIPWDKAIKMMVVLEVMTQEQADNLLQL